MRGCVGLAACLAFGACASTSFEEFFTDFSDQWHGLPAPSGTVSVASVSHPADVSDALEMFSEGYAFIGVSSFNGPLENNSSVLANAQKIGAEKVLVSSRYTDTRTGSISIPTTRAVTTTESGTVSASGRDGLVAGSYAGTSTTYVPTTTMLPWQVQRYDQTALYFAPLGPSCLGIWLLEPTDAERLAAGTNRVATVAAIREGSPAYLADILAGDLLVSINGQTVANNASDILLRSGEEIRVRIKRQVGEAGGIRRDVEVNLRAGTCTSLTVENSSIWTQASRVNDVGPTP
jgi:hypothetical protein